MFGFRIWFRALLLVLAVFLGIELCIFVPKEQAVRGAETVAVQTGGLVTVDLDSGQVTVYRRGLLLPRYFAQKHLLIKPGHPVDTTVRTWYTRYIAHVDLQGQIRTADMHRTFDWLWYPLVWSFFLTYPARLRFVQARRKREETE